MRLPAHLFLSAALLLAMAGPALADGFIGTVRTFEGEARVVRDGVAYPAETGFHILANDVLETGDGALGVIFRDDTAITLGPHTEIIVDSFVFDPAGDNIEFATEMIRGSAMFVTGQIAKINPEAFRLETPKATIGIRGTRFIVDLD